MVVVADVGVHQLAGEIQVAVAVVVPEIRALGGRDRQRLQRLLRGPGMKDVRPVHRVDMRAEVGIWLIAAHGVRFSCRLTLLVRATGSLY
jgi:hypothetical protein